MSFFLRGNQTQFIFSKFDIESLIKEICENGYFLFENWITDISLNGKIISYKQICDVLLRDKYSIDFNIPQFLIVPIEKADLIIWIENNLNDGTKRYYIDSMKSHAVEIQLSRQNNDVISLGRISVCSEWEDDDKIIKSATYELDVYKKMKNMLRRLSVGKIGGILVGFDAYDQCEKGIRQLSYDLNNPDTYTLEQITLIKKKR